MASTSSSGALLASSQSPLVMCTFPQMLFRESSVSCAIVHIAWLAGHDEMDAKVKLDAIGKTSCCQISQALAHTLVLRLPVQRICAIHIESIRQTESDSSLQAMLTSRSHTTKYNNAHMMDPAWDQQLAELCGQVSRTVWNVCVTDTQHQHHRRNGRYTQQLVQVSGRTQASMIVEASVGICYGDQPQMA
jgi:hypothetical protein